MNISLFRENYSLTVKGHRQYYADYHRESRNNRIKYEKLDDPPQWCVGIHRLIHIGHDLRAIRNIKEMIPKTITDAEVIEMCSLRSAQRAILKHLTESARRWGLERGFKWWSKHTRDSWYGTSGRGTTSFYFGGSTVEVKTVGPFCCDHEFNYHPLLSKAWEDAYSVTDAGQTSLF